MSIRGEKMNIKLTAVFIQAYSYWNYTYSILEKNKSEIRNLIASSMFLTSNFAFSCELYLKGINAWVFKKDSSHFFKSFKHDIGKMFYNLPDEIREKIITECQLLYKKYKPSYFDTEMDFHIVLEQNRFSFDKCRYFFDNLDLKEQIPIHFFFLVFFAMSMHFWVLDNTDFDIEKTKQSMTQ